MVTTILLMEFKLESWLWPASHHCCCFSLWCTWQAYWMSDMYCLFCSLHKCIHVVNPWKFCNNRHKCEGSLSNSLTSGITITNRLLEILGRIIITEQVSGYWILLTTSLRNLNICEVGLDDLCHFKLIHRSR